MKGIKSVLKYYNARIVFSTLSTKIIIFLLPNDKIFAQEHVKML